MKRKQTQRGHEICCYPQLIKASSWSLCSGFSGVLGRARPPVKLVGGSASAQPWEQGSKQSGPQKERKWGTPRWESCEGESHGHQTGKRIALLSALQETGHPSL